MANSDHAVVHRFTRRLANMVQVPSILLPPREAYRIHRNPVTIPELFQTTTYKTSGKTRTVNVVNSALAESDTNTSDGDLDTRELLSNREPNICEVSNPSKQDKLLRARYNDLPRLRNVVMKDQFGELVEHSFQFSSWPEVAPQMDIGAVLKALDFIESRFFVNLSRITPKHLSLMMRDAVSSDKGDHEHHWLAVDGDPAIALTPIYVCDSQLLTEDVNIGKELCGFMHSEEFNRMMACIGMAFGSSSLSTVTHHGSLRFTTIGGVAGCEDVGPNTWRNHGLPQHAKVPVYDASQFFAENRFSFDLNIAINKVIRGKYNVNTAMTDLGLERIEGEIDGACALVAHSYWAGMSFSLVTQLNPSENPYSMSNARNPSEYMPCRHGSGPLPTSKDDAGARRGNGSSQNTAQSPSSPAISQEFVHTSAASIAETSEKPPPKCLQCRPRSRFVESCSVSDGNKSCDFCITRNYKCSYEFPPRSGNAMTIKTPNKRPAPEDDHSSDDEPLSARVSEKRKQARYEGPVDMARRRLQEDDPSSTPITFSVSLTNPREPGTTQPSTGATSSPPIPPSNPQARVIIPASNYGQPSAPPPLPPPQHTTSKVRCYNCRFRRLECLALLAVQADGTTAEGDSCVFCRVNGYSCSIVRDRQSQMPVEQERDIHREEQQEQQAERQRVEEGADRRTDRRSEDEDESPSPDLGLPTPSPPTQDAASSLPTPVSPVLRPVTPARESARYSPPAATPPVTTSSPSAEPPEPRTPVRIIIPRRASAASRSTTITVLSPTPSDATLITSVSRDVSPLKLTALSPSRSKVDLLKKQWEIERLTEEVEDLRKEIRVEKEYTELKVKKLVKAGKRSEAKAMEVDQETTQVTLKKALANQEKLLDIERCSLQILEMKFFDGGRPE